MATYVRDVVITQHRSSWGKVLAQWPDNVAMAQRRRVMTAVITTGAYEDPLIAIAWTEGELVRMNQGGHHPVTTGDLLFVIGFPIFVVLVCLVVGLFWEEDSPMDAVSALMVAWWVAIVVLVLGVAVVHIPHLALPFIFVLAVVFAVLYW